MTDFAAARRMMVDGQVRTADVTDPRLLAAMLELPRERFFPGDKASLAYLDLDVPVSDAGQPVRRLLKPMVLAKLIQAAGIADTDRVLDVGCGTGYSTALLAHLAGSVVGLEEDAESGPAGGRRAGCGRPADRQDRDRPLCARLRQRRPLRCDHVAGIGRDWFRRRCSTSSRTAAGLSACSGRGPAGKAMLYRRIEGDLSGRPVFDAAAAPLPGFAKPQEFVF